MLPEPGKLPKPHVYGLSYTVGHVAGPIETPRSVAQAHMAVPGHCKRTGNGFDEYQHRHERIVDITDHRCYGRELGKFGKQGRQQQCLGALRQP